MAVIYCRVSTKEQVDEGGSLATQEKICKEYALKSGYGIVHTFIEQGESAKNADRTQLKKLLSYCAIKKNNVGVVIAYKIDRIARNIDDYRQIRLSLKMQGIEIKSTSEYFEDTPAGRFMENIIANVAQFDNDVRTERSVGGMKDAIREGRFVWAAPVGYRNVKIGSKSNIAQTEMALLVRKAFEEVAKEMRPIEEIRRELVATGLVTTKGKPISKSYFYKMLTNELYTGWINGFNEHVKGVFEPIVTQQLFDHVQHVLKRRKHNTTQYKRDNPDFPLRRFVSHPSGKKLTGCWAKGRKQKYPYYLFRIKGMEYKKAQLEGAFKAFFDQFRLNDAQHSKLRTRIKENIIKAIEGQRREIALNQNSINLLKERQRGLIQKNLDGVISNDLLREQLAYIDGELALASSYSISPFDFKKDNIDQAFDLVSAYLKKPSTIWEIAPLACKLKLQWFNFPSGVTFDGKKFRTAEICSLFKAKDTLRASKSRRVNPRISSSNNPNITGGVYWDNLAKEITRLAAIIEEIHSTPECIPK